MQRESLICDFLSFDPIRKGDTITVKYLEDWPAYVRPQGTGWFFWVSGVIFMAIGLWELVKLQRE